ncbi:MAG: SusC/RagA family TonB-linked outer membrane protein [Candidatus Cryptobacteroides sp.]
MRFINSIAATLLLALSTLLGANAQDRLVSGTVLDTQQQPVIGASVMVAGTRQGTVTDPDGTFSLKIPEGDVTLEVACLGYTTVNTKVSAGTSRITVTLEEDNMLLEETVVVGYGTQKKVNLTGAITSIDSKSLENRVSHSVSTMLQGSVPGLNISTSSGNPGSTGSLNVRGYTSINGADPLVLIDGAVGDIDRVNPNDIESISVIKDAAAAAVYGARAAFGVILVTTKSGKADDGKATVRYSGRFGWEEPTTSTDYETRGYWSVYTHNVFRMNSEGNQYVKYDEYDMQQLLARVNDKTENPDRPWVVERTVNGLNQWRYYGNNDWWHMLFNDRHPVQQHNVSISGGAKNVKYFVSGGLDHQVGIIKQRPDVYNKYNLRSKVDFDINKYMKFSNNTSFYSSLYDFVGVGDIQNAITYTAAHALPIFPMQNPDGSWLYKLKDFFNSDYGIGNGRHIVYGEGKNTNLQRKTDFSNTSELTIKPVKGLSIVANFTYRFHQNRNTSRTTNFTYRRYPGADLEKYDSGAGLDELTEKVQTYNYYATNIFATYENTFADKHHLTVMVGGNYEAENRKDVGATGDYLLTENLSDLNLVGTNADGATVMSVTGGRSDYAILGYFGRINYDFAGRYLFEISGRYDGSSRLASGHRWGFFPSGSIGWRISEEPFFANAKKTVDNLKLRASFGTLGNQIIRDSNGNIVNDAAYRTISIHNFASYNFGEGSTVGKYSSISAPNSSDLTWETSEQWNVGLDLDMFKSRLQFTGEAYIRDTKNMLTDGYELPSVYGADAPKQNTADLRTKGLEFSLSWRDQFMLAGHPFGYGIKGMISVYDSEITKYENRDKTFAKKYYKGMKLGEIWGFVADDLFQTNEEAQEYASQVDLSYVGGKLSKCGGWSAGDLKYIDLDGDGKIGIGKNNVESPGDRKILGNSLARLQYGFTLNLDYFGFDISAFFQGTGNHYWYPHVRSFAFWGPFSQPMCSYLPKDFLQDCWSENNPDAYFPRPVAYLAYDGGSQLNKVNSRYLQNIRYLRFKNLTVGYTVPQKLTRKIKVDKIRVSFTGENLCYWSPFKKHSAYIDPEAAFNRSNNDYNRMFYPWQKTYMFGIDVTF